MQNFIIRITQENVRLLNDAAAGCFILPCSLPADFAAKFTDAAHLKNKLVLAEGKDAAEFYLQCGADGFIADTSADEKPGKTVKELRRRYKKAVIGAITRNRRHEAMLVSEAEPDFVIFRFWKDGFEGNKELLQWYSELFLIQCAAQIEEPCDYASLPADFIIISDTEYKNK